ncbi:hypothetical protein LCGC14_1129770, partial [marine sediment metagenome]
MARAKTVGYCIGYSFGPGGYDLQRELASGMLCSVTLRHQAATVFASRRSAERAIRHDIRVRNGGETFDEYQ